MAANSKGQLLSAIEAYSKEHGGSKAHEDIVSQLQRLVAEVHRGTGAPQDSPGRNEAKQAAERSKPDSGGHETANKPGPGFQAHQPSEHPNVAGGQGPLQGSDVVFTRGNTVSNDAAPSAREQSGRPENPGIPDRRNPDQRHDPRAADSAANVQSNKPAPAARSNDSLGQAQAPSTSNVGHASAPNPAGAQPEGKPPYAGEDIRKVARDRLKAAHRAS